MNDIQDSKIDKEAVQFAFLMGEEANLELVKTCWAACTCFILAEIEHSVSEECFKKICEKCGIIT